MQSTGCFLKIFYNSQKKIENRKNDNVVQNFNSEATCLKQLAFMINIRVHREIPCAFLLVCVTSTLNIFKTNNPILNDSRKSVLQVFLCKTVEFHFLESSSFCVTSERMNVLPSLNFQGSEYFCNEKFLIKRLLYLPILYI